MRIARGSWKNCSAEVPEGDVVMKISIIGLSLSSSWGNGHATTYRSLIKGLLRRGHEVSFFERNESWYSAHRDLPRCNLLHFYGNAKDLLHRWHHELGRSDLIIIGSYVLESSELARELKKNPDTLLAFYDIDTPVTIAQVRNDRCSYLERDLLPEFDLYLSFSGGTVLDELQSLGAKRPVAFYCSVDPDVHFPLDVPTSIDLGYLGTWSEDRQAPFTELLLGPALRWNDGRFAVAGPQYPDADEWPRNVSHVSHLPPQEHAAFYCSQRFTLNLTRSDMRRMGYSPSVRLFEAASCGTPIISDDWPGLDSLFRDGEEILIARDGDEVLEFVREMDEDERAAIGAAARNRVLEGHTGEQRAAELETHVAGAR
jgi:spore maturation protein CgeB